MLHTFCIFKRFNFIMQLIVIFGSKSRYNDSLGPVVLYQNNFFKIYENFNQFIYSTRFNIEYEVFTL